MRRAGAGGGGKGRHRSLPDCNEIVPNCQGTAGAEYAFMENRVIKAQVRGGGSGVVFWGLFTTFPVRSMTWLGAVRPATHTTTRPPTPHNHPPTHPPTQLLPRTWLNPSLQVICTA